MFWIVSMGVALLVFMLVWFIANRLRKSDDNEDQAFGRWLKLGAIAVFILWSGGMNAAAESFCQVPAGHVGVVYEFGAIKGQITEGFQTVAPWRSVHIASTQVKRHVFDKMECFSQETQTVYVKASLNVSVSPQAIQELYRSVGPDYFNVLIEPRVNQNFKDEIVKYKSVDIAPNREKIRHEVRKRLENELSEHSIRVDDLLLDNVDFRPEFESAIEAKQIATQRSLEEEQKVVMERHRAEQALERARGEGNALLAVAEKQAEANRKLSDSLTPTLVQYTMVQKLSDKIQVVILPSGQNFILDPSMLKNKDIDKK